MTEGRRAPARSLLRRAAVAGIVVAATEDRLPALCSTVIELRDGDGTARVHRVGRGEVVDDVLAAGVTDATARRAARALARFDDPELEVAGAGLPRPSACSRCSGLDPPTADGLRRAVGGGGRRSRPARPARRRRGRGAGGRPRPRRSARAGRGHHRRRQERAAAHARRRARRRVLRPTTSPSCSSTSRAAAPSTGAPGCPTPSGSSPTSTRTWRQRALRCLEAELRHRERTLASRGRGRPRPSTAAVPHQGPPLPRLVVVVDEFATLKAELPDFVDSLVGVAQRGRSLGVHLVLATQRPSGAVSDNIRANTNLRIALRVQDAADSTDVIDRPDAARIGREPARAGPRPARARRGRADPDRAGDRAARRPVTGRWWSARSGSGRGRRRSPPPKASPARARSPTSSGSSTRRRRRTAGRDGRRLGGRGRTRCRPRSTSTR